MDWIKGKFTGKPHIKWENLWFPVNFPLIQSIDIQYWFKGDISCARFTVAPGAMLTMQFFRPWAPTPPKGKDPVFH